MVPSKKCIYILAACAFLLDIESSVTGSSSEGREHPQGPLCRGPSRAVEDPFDKHHPRISFSDSEDEEGILPTFPQPKKKGFRKFLGKINPQSWGSRNPKERSRTVSQNSISSDSDFYSEPDPDPSTPLSPVQEQEASVKSFPLSAEPSPFTMKILAEAEAKGKLKRLLEEEADFYHKRNEDFTRNLQEFRTLVDGFISRQPALKSMTSEEKDMFFASYYT